MQDNDAICSQSSLDSSGRSSICQPKFAVSLKWNVQLATPCSSSSTAIEVACRLSSKIKFHVRFENVLAQLPPEGVSGDPTQEMASAPSLPKATAEFIGPPADNASRRTERVITPSVCLHQVDQGLPTHTKRLIPTI